MLELTVFLSGALVMVLEMVGGRVLAPHVGTSAIVWTSLIGVILACLALGAWAGGRFADKRLSRHGLGQALAGAGAGCGLTAFGHTAIGTGVTGVLGNLYVAAVAAAVATFALPAFFFGMITPYVIRLRIASVDTAGATVGRLYALSTAGSILGTFLGGFVLISWFGSTLILWALAVAMLLLSLANYRKRPWGRLFLLLLCIFLAWQDTLYAEWLAEKNGTRLVESPYNSIRIMEGVDYTRGGTPVRLMATDPGYSHSGMRVDAPDDLYFDYTRYYALGPRFVPGARRLLMLGGGGYSVPKWLLSGKSGLADDLSLTVVELDPAMTESARRWFGLRDDPRLTIRHEDARSFLNRQDTAFDLVFVDVFNSHYSVPFQMGTVEAARALRRAVAPGGALAMNVISAVEGPDGRLFRGIWHAFAQAFAEVRVYCVGSLTHPERVQNLMLVAFPEAQTDALPDQPSGIAPLTEGMEARRYTGAIPPGLPLRDDYAPVERFTLMLARQ